MTFLGLAPYLYYTDAAAALDWMSRVLGFREVARHVVDDDGTVREAEMAVGDARIHLCGLDPAAYRRPAGQLVIVYVDDVDAHHDITPINVVITAFGQTWTFWQDLIT